MKKILVVGIILLFLGVTIAPTINFNIVKASTGNDFVEVTSEPCGVKSYGNTTVKLTRQQYQSLEEYLVDFKARLNQTKTKEEAIPLFKDAVVELNKYGLLPKGMSVVRAQRFVVGNFGTQGDITYRNNSLCLVCGFGLNFNYSNFFTVLSNVLWKLGLEDLSLRIWVFGFIKPIGLLNYIVMDKDYAQYGESVYSFGLHGFKFVWGFCAGTIRGFTGIKLFLLGKYVPEQVIFGTAVHLSIYSAPYQG